ncbi:PPC domain-containing DNA-binding protein [Anaerosphaera multitolerans]|uniref:DNA-binding protein n=1 Tax=Anaerosphaera multitolerans TaxID=2487351 RepID=A0A437S6Z6_9FIRM|nr:PPC domain-containing DNA-binding protein [Anaerosphaera multitolerans]RVU54786.1 DNA-binding protein [Anaerosphaera multitolerans]
MEGKVFKDKAVLRVDKGEEVIESIFKFIEENKITLANVSGIGASNNITVGLFNTETKEYNTADYFGEDFEITAFMGNITTKDGEYYVHMHITFSDENQNTFGGHLNKCIISGACEIFFDIIEGEVKRYFDEEIGLNIMKF